MLCMQVCCVILIHLGNEWMLTEQLLMLYSFNMCQGVRGSLLIREASGMIRNLPVNVAGSLNDSTPGGQIFIVY